MCILEATYTCLDGCGACPSFIRARIATSNVCRPSGGVLSLPVLSFFYSSLMLLT